MGGWLALLLYREMLLKNRVPPAGDGIVLIAPAADRPPT
jgi:hypothetical protein